MSRARDLADGTFSGAFSADSPTLVVDATNNKVGIGTTAPNNYYAKDLVIAAPDEGGVTVVSDPTHSAYLLFADGTSGADQYRGQIFYDHNVDRLGIAANGSTRLLIDSDGLKFNGDTAAANALDDYEEGTWTPYLARWTGGNISATYTVQQGRYTKVGRLVTVAFDIQVSAIASQGSSLNYISGAPFNIDGERDYEYTGIWGVRTAISSSDVAMGFVKHATNNSILIRTNDDFNTNYSGGWQVGSVRGCLTYEV